MKCNEDMRSSLHFITHYSWCLLYYRG